MLASPGLLDGRQAVVRIEMAGPGAIAQLTDRIEARRWRFVLFMRARLKVRRVAAGA